MKAGQVVSAAEALAARTNGCAPTSPGPGSSRTRSCSHRARRVHRCGDRAETAVRHRPAAAASGSARRSTSWSPRPAPSSRPARRPSSRSTEELASCVRARPPPKRPRLAPSRTPTQAARDAGIGREFRLLACSSRRRSSSGVVPPGRAKMHNHPYDEVAYVVEGEGVLHWEDGTRSRSAPARASTSRASSSTRWRTRAARTCGSWACYVGHTPPTRRCSTDPRSRI